MRVQPIRNIEKIESIKKYLKENNSYRDYFLFVLGINVGKRMGDLVKLKVKDVRNRDRLVSKDQKTGKIITVKLNDKIKKEIYKYCKDKKDNDFLFESRQKKDGLITNIGYKRAYDILKKVWKICRVEDAGTHTLRKTFGYWHYKRTGKLEELRIIYRHSSIHVTKRYMGVETDEIDKSIDEFGGL